MPEAANSRAVRPGIGMRIVNRSGCIGSSLLWLFVVEKVVGEFAAAQAAKASRNIARLLGIAVLAASLPSNSSET